MLSLPADYARTPDNVDTLIMQESLIMRTLLIMRIPLSGRSWASEAFNTMITLNTYQFLPNLHTLVFFVVICKWFKYL